MKINRIDIKGEVYDIEAYENPIPTGSVFPFVGIAAPKGFLLCNGQEVSRIAYARLFNVIKEKFGAGDGSTTFNIPDLRGEFLRGAGTNSHYGQGNGGAVGEHQDATRHITMSQWTENNQTGGNVGFYGYGGTNSTIKNRDSNVGLTDRAYKLHVALPNLSTEELDVPYYTSRPTNTSVNYIIKY